MASVFFQIYFCKLLNKSSLDQAKIFLKLVSTTQKKRNLSCTRISENNLTQCCVKNLDFIHFLDGLRKWLSVSILIYSTRSSKWAKIAKCSPDTALRDINDLVQKDILEKELSGGRSTSYILKTIQ